MRNIQLSTRFALVTGGICGLVYLLFVLLSYNYLKEQTLHVGSEKAHIILDIMNGIDAYINQTLRPRIINLMPDIQENPHAFIPEILSTTKIKNIVLEKAKLENFQFTYKRMSINPRNKDNSLNELYAEILTIFQKNKDLNEWQGIKSIDKHKFFILAKPIYIKENCLRCHGDINQAPVGLIAKYGSQVGFGFKLNDLMGLEAVSISMDVIWNQIIQTIINICTIGIIIIVLLFIAIEGSFIRLVGHPLKKIAQHFTNISQNMLLDTATLKIKKHDEIGELIQSFNIMIENLKQAYENIKSNATILQTIINGISDPLALIGKDCNMIAANNTYQEWLSKNKKMVLNIMEKEQQNCNAETITCQKIKELLNNKEEIIEKYKTENDEYYLIHLYPIKNNQNEVVKIVHYIQDITKQRRLELQMAHAEKMAIIGQMAAGFAHEINNPLSIIQCYTKLLMKKFINDQETINDLKIIEKHTNSSKNIVENLLYFSRHKKTIYEQIDINKIILETLSIIKKQFEKKNIFITNRLQEDIPMIYGDREKLKQVLLNILINAEQAISGHGEITITTGFDEDRNEVSVSIKDTGCGIPEQHLMHVFEPFFTTKPPGEGTGLGLFVSYDIIHEHNGDIILKSTEHQGTEIFITLPALMPENQIDK